MATEKRKIEVSNNSIKTAGVTDDYRDAVKEYIWNAFDARATRVEIEFDASSPLLHIHSFVIKDNGEGIDYDTLPLTFGKFLDSQKSLTNHRSSYNHGKKGKGRFTFRAFSHKAHWKTIYKSKKSFDEYEIEIGYEDSDFYTPTEPSISKNAKATGTVVTFTQVFGVTGADLLSDSFKDYLKAKFGWFLHLNKDLDFNIYINGERLAYEDIIADSEIVLKKFESQNRFWEFKINFIRWNTKIGDKFFYYYIDLDKIEKDKEFTSLNNKADDFFIVFT